MQCGLAPKVPGVENFEEIELAAAGGPTAAVGIGAVLRRARDLCIEHPNGRHVPVESGLSCIWHGEFKEEHLFGTVKPI